MSDILSSSLQHQAITAALSANWLEAVKLNEQIMELEPTSVECLNRLARAYFELGDLGKSKKHYEQALKIDPYNQIASKFLKRIEAFKKREGKYVKLVSDNHHPTLQNISDLFIEEPGKTKQITLSKVAEPQKILALSCGDQVTLVAKSRAISVVDSNNEYLGVLPDDIGHRLLRFMKGGNKYNAYIKTIKPNGLSILIKETYRSSRFRNQPTFLEAAANSKLTYSSDHIFLGDDMDEKSESDEEDGEALN